MGKNWGRNHILASRELLLSSIASLPKKPVTATFELYLSTTFPYTRSATSSLQPVNFQCLLPTFLPSYFLPSSFFSTPVTSWGDNSLSSAQCLDHITMCVGDNCSSGWLKVFNFSHASVQWWQQRRKWRILVEAGSNINPVFCCLLRRKKPAADSLPPCLSF